MANKTTSLTDKERVSMGQSIPLGDTGDGQTGVPADEQGISNRPGDSDDEADEDDEDDEDDEEYSEVDDPEAEPGKPV